MTAQNGTGKTGAPIGNRNGLRHGLRAGRLPPGCGAIRKSCDAMRRQLEDRVFAQRGVIDIDDAGLIQSAVRWERHAMLTQRWLRLSFDELSHADRLNYSREIARASSERDKVIAALRIESTDDDPWFTPKLPRIASDAAPDAAPCDDQSDRDPDAVPNHQNATADGEPERNAGQVQQDGPDCSETREQQASAVLERTDAEPSTD